MIIWALFDSDTSDYQKALNMGVISIGLHSGGKDLPNIINLDLSNNECFKTLDKLPKPDIIFASPPCETWSRCSTYKGYPGNRYWARNKGEPFIPQYHPDTNHEKRIMGINTIVTTLHIIERYDPKYWVIENPMTSMIWDFISDLKVGYHNKVRYNNYDDTFSQKPTIFFSNIKLDLDNTVVKTPINMQQCKTGYGVRSMLPYPLIREIYRQIKEENDKINHSSIH